MSADVALQFLLNHITQILDYNYHLIADVPENIKSLRNELEYLKCIVEDFERYNRDSDYVKKVVKDIRVLTCQAEDAIESFILQAAEQSSRTGASKVIHNFADKLKLRRETGVEINSIIEAIKKIRADHVPHANDSLLNQALTSDAQPVEPKERPKVEEEHVIGFETAAKDVEKLLTKGPEQLQVVSIVGMLGLGKTTLANKVFKDLKVDYEYMIRAFVYISKDYKKRDVFLEILSSFTQVSDDVKEKKVEDLQDYLYKQLEGKQYLIVLDDVYEPEDWDEFKRAFPNNETRCRVLITTRNEKVAEYTNPEGRPYKLDFLDLEKSRELLCWRVFQKNSCPDEEFVKYEIEIAKKCAGLPLAIVVIAGIIWRHRNNIKWWKIVTESVKDYIATDDKETTKVLDIMYKHLPNYLKPCFLYLGVFREDFEIPVWKLIRMWVAEKLIQTTGDSNLEDMAEIYLEELVYRNLVMVGKKRTNEKIKTCRIHDTLREFCKKEAAKNNLFQEMMQDKSSFCLAGNSSLETCRRICLNNVDISEYLSKKPSGKCVRSFLTFYKDKKTVKQKLAPRIPKSFKLLRVLEVQSLMFTCLPTELYDLGLLKYIAISSNYSKIPQEFSDLVYLQTLIVNTTSSSLEIKADIWKLPEFRHLHTNVPTNLPSPKEDARGGDSVQTLSTISPESCRKEVFERTPKLRKLGIRGVLTRLFQTHDNPSVFGYLQTLECLETLKLLNDDTTSETSKLYGLPPHNSFPKQLRKLTLMNTQLEWTEMTTLGELKHLEVLILKEFAFQGNSWKTAKGGFTRLKYLYIGRMDLVAWEGASTEHFPQLRSLVLKNCESLQAIPRGLEDIPSLNSVILHCTNTAVASSARKLQLLKIDQAKKDNTDSILKLSIYPPDH
ncbi:OLC1v1031981C1 [Oldenlandia corymbosa var. corymbosa]|uniref:OLC1v1031981C1 n=1 Tax=Oldenlandia corymbosa var. corymbosa TaxID=529605 RepID=A0AAV1CN14_OLDCO|nr:OLC1v1031981C1 [Oldenlandia corymbosa var. corymbosa]